MTEKLYLADAELRIFDATVQAVNDDLIELDKTAFYVTGGGQPHDTGLLRWNNTEALIEDVRTVEGRVWHQLAGEIPNVGSEVTGIVDDERRHQLMRTHTAMHILCGVMWQRWQRVVTGGNMDSMVNRYTADRKKRSDDAYTPGGLGGTRPDRSVIVYTTRLSESN